MNDRAVSTQSKQPRAVGRAYARAQIYGLLARLLAYPSRELTERVLDLAPQTLAAADYLRLPAGEVGRLVERIAASGAEEIERSYQHCFTLTYSPDVPAYEVAYVSSEVFRQTQEMADIAGFYRAFGAGIAERDPERVDHISVELSFMQLLCLKEAYAAGQRETEHLQVSRKAQRAFLRDHLLCWAPALAGRLATIGGASIHGDAGRLLLTWLDRERITGRVEPRQLYERPLPIEAEPEEACAAESIIPLMDITGGGPS